MVMLETTYFLTDEFLCALEKDRPHAAAFLKEKGVTYARMGTASPAQSWNRHRLTFPGLSREEGPDKALKDFDRQVDDIYAVCIVLDTHTEALAELERCKDHLRLRPATRDDVRVGSWVYIDAYRLRQAGHKPPTHHRLLQTRVRERVAFGAVFDVEYGVSVKLDVDELCHTGLYVSREG